MKFEKAAKQAKRLKLLVYGASGTGKTTTALHFPDPAVVDLEKGTDYYGEHFEFARIQTQDLGEINEAIEDLLEDPSGVKTLVIDPFTKWYLLLQEKVLRELMAVKGFDYVMQPKDWGIIKKEVEIFINKLLALDLNIVCTCQEKTEYSFTEGDFMTPVGFGPAGPKDIAFPFDVVLRLRTEPDGTHMATVIKDRTNKITTTEFEYTYQGLVGFFGNEELEREPVSFTGKKYLDEQAGRREEIFWNGKTMMTAGATAEQLDRLVALNIDKSELRQRIMNDYKLESALDLGADELELLIEDLTNQPNV